MVVHDESVIIADETVQGSLQVDPWAIALTRSEVTDGRAGVTVPGGQVLQRPGARRIAGDEQPAVGLRVAQQHHALSR